MPVDAIWNAEWLNQNANRFYPISEEASNKDVTGSFEIPRDLIVDLVWPVQTAAIVQSDRFYVYSIAIFGSGITITLGYHIVGDPEGVPIGSVSIPSDTHQTNQSYFIAGTGTDFYDSVGKITIGNLDNSLGVAGYYKFDLNGARLESTVVRPNLRGVSAIILINGEDVSDPLAGDIELVAGTNIRLVPTPSAGPGYNPQIRIDAITGAGLVQDCSCSGTRPADAPCIRTINGIPPDNDGNFTLQGDDCLELEPIENGININDKCSEACCGCEELKKILGDLDILNAQVSTLESFASKLNAQVDAAVINLLASKSGDLPCNP